MRSNYKTINISSQKLLSRILRILRICRPLHTNGSCVSAVRLKLQKKLNIELERFLRKNILAISFLAKLGYTFS